MNTIVSIIKESGIKKPLFFLCFIMAVVSSLLSLLPARFTGYSLSILAGSAENTFFTGLLPFTEPLYLALGGIFLFFLFTVISVIFRNIFCYYASLLSLKIVTSIREKLFNKILRLDFLTCSSINKGEIIHRIMGDTQRLETIFSTPFYTLFSDILDLFFISLFLLRLDPLLLLIALSVVPLILLAANKSAQIQKRVMQGIQISNGELTARTEQVLSGFETVKCLNGEDFEEKLFHEESRKTYKLHKKADKTLTRFYPVEGILRGLGTSLVLFYAIWSIQKGEMELGVTAVLLQYCVKFYSPIRNFSRHYQSIQRGITAGQKICDFLRLREETSSPHPVCFDKPHSEIRFENVSLNIDGREILKNFSFHSYRGELIVIKGPSGSGKSTLLRILAGLYTHYTGNIYIDNVNLREIPLKELRDRLGISSQKVFLHNMSLRENIYYPKRAENGADTWLHKVGLHHKDPEEKAGEEGKNLSGGERVRMGFARALVRNSNILLLDEITSGLDIENENRMIDILKDLKGKKSVFFISHSENSYLTEIADRVIDIKTHCSDLCKNPQPVT